MAVMPLADSGGTTVDAPSSGPFVFVLSRLERRNGFFMVKWLSCKSQFCFVLLLLCAQRLVRVAGVVVVVVVVQPREAQNPRSRGLWRGSRDRDNEQEQQHQQERRQQESRTNCGVKRWSCHQKQNLPEQRSPSQASFVLEAREEETETSSSRTLVRLVLWKIWR